MASLLNFAKRAYDQANPLDNGRTFKNPQGRINPGLAPSAFQQATHNGLTNVAGNMLVKPLTQAGHTLYSGVAAPVRLAAGEISQNDLAIRNARMSAPTPLQFAGAATVPASFAIGGPLLKGGEKLAAPVVGKIAPPVIKKLVNRVIANTVAAPAGGLYSAGSGLSQGGSPKDIPKNLAQGTLITAGIGAGTPIAFAGAKGGGKLAVKVAKNRVPLNEDGGFSLSSAAERHPAVQQLDQTADLLKFKRDQMRNNGMSENAPELKATTRAYQMTLNQRDQTLSSIQQGGYAKLPGKNPKLDAYNQAIQQHGGVAKALPKGIKPTDIKDTQVFGSSTVKGSTPHDIDVALTLPEGHPALEGSPVQPGRAMVGNIHYSYFADNEVGQLARDQFINTGRKGAQPAVRVQNTNSKNPSPAGKQTPPLSVKPKTGETQAGKGKGIRQFPTTLKNAPQTPEDFGVRIKEMQYVKVPNKETLTTAINQVKANPSQALEDALAIGKKKSTTQLEQAKALAIQDNLIQNGKYELADQLYQSIAKSRTEVARALQIGAAYARTTPSGIYNFSKQLGANPQVAKDFYNRAVDIASMPAGRNKDLARAVMMRDAATLTKKGAGKKAQQALYFAQLLNPKTAIRNVGGNFFALIGQNIADTIGTPIDIATSAITGKARSTYLPNPITQIKGAAKGFKEGRQEAKLGVDLMHGDKYGVKPGVFTKGIGPKLEKALANELSVPDRTFFQAAYSQKLSNLMKGAKVKQPTEVMRAEAKEFGLNMTYQNDSALADAAMRIKKGLNINKDIGAGSFVLNYPKTPANLLNFAIDFSPGGLARALADTVKPLIGAARHTDMPFNKDLFVRNLSRGIVGTGGLVGTGAVLHNLGIITADENKNNKDVSALQRTTGLGKYKVNVSALKRYVLGGFDKGDAKLRPGDQLVSYDWAQPLSISLAMGANLDQTNNSKLTANKKVAAAVGGLGNNFASGIQTLTDQPLLQGVQGLTGGGGGITQGAIKTAEGVPTAFIPSLLRQTRQLADNTARNTYDPSFGGKVIATAENSVPGLSKRLSPQVNPLGDTNEVYPQGGNNPFNVFANPAFVSKYSPKQLTGEISRLYNKTGDKGVVPNPISGTQQVGGKTIILDPKQYNTLQATYGKTNQAVLGSLIQTAAYKNADDLGKSKMIASALRDTLATSKAALFGGTGSLTTRQKQLAQGQTPDYTSSSLKKGQKLSPADRYKQASSDYKTNQSSMSDPQRIKAESSLARQKVQSGYSQNTLDLYSLSKKQLSDYLNANPKGNDLAQQLNKLDQELYNSGVTSTLKYKNGFAPSTKTAGRSSKTSGTRTTRVKSGPKYTLRKISTKRISAPKGIKVRKLAAFKAPKTRKLATSKIPKLKVA